LLLPTQAKQALKRWLHGRGGMPGPLFCQLAKTQRCSDQDHVQRNRSRQGCLPTEPINAHQVYALLRRRCRQAKLKPCSPHDLRRTFISKLLEQGVDFNTTRQLAGHEHLQTTALYDRRTVKTQRQRVGLQQVRIHDLKHTFGRRLRAANVSFEDRQDLLGHKSSRITDHYSSAELANLIAAAEKVCITKSRKIHATEN